MAARDIRGVLRPAAPVARVGLLPLEQPLTWPRWDDGTVRMALVDQDGSPVDVTGWQFFQTFRTRNDGGAGASLLSRSGAITSAAGGLVAFGYDSVDWTNFAERQEYRHDVIAIDPDGARHQVVPQSSFLVLPAVGQPGEVPTVPVGPTPLPYPVASVEGEDGVEVDNTDPRNPVASLNWGNAAVGDLIERGSPGLVGRSPFTLGAPLSPASWLQKKAAGNPIIRRGTNPAEQVSCYVPKTIRVGDYLWTYVKQETPPTSIGAYRAPVSNPEAVEYMGAVVPQGASGAWDDGGIVDPAVVYDAESGVIHLWYRGNSSVGYVLVSDDDPAVGTKQGASPILVPADIDAALGLTPGLCTHVSIDTVIRIDGEWIFYGTFYQNNAPKKVLNWWGSGPTPDDITVQGAALSPDTSNNLCYALDVFRHPSAPAYICIFTEGIENDAGSISLALLRCAWSFDGKTGWTKFDDWLMIPTGTKGQADREGRVYCGSVVKESAAPYSAIQFVNNRVLFYYSQSLSASHVSGGGDLTGLAYLLPSLARDGSRRVAQDVYRASAQSIPNATWTTVVFNTQAIYEPDDVFEDLTTGVAKFRVDGLYEIKASVTFAGNPNGTRGIWIIIAPSNATPYYVDAAPANPNDPSNPAITRPKSMQFSILTRRVAGESFRIQVRHDGVGGALNLVSYESRLSIVRLGP